MSRIPAWLCLLASAPGCELVTRSCTDVYCEDSLALSIDGPPSAWASGPHTLDLQLDRSHRCLFELPVTLAAGDSLPLACTPELTSPFGPAATLHHRPPPEAPCPAPGAGDPSNAGDAGGLGDAGHEGCAPRYRIEVRASAAPTRVTVRLAAGDTPLLDHTSNPTYSRLQPNGPECGPTCRNATLELTLPPR